MWGVDIVNKMRPVFTMTLLLHLSDLMVNIIGSTYYKREKSKILAESVIKRWTDRSTIACLLQCHKNAYCKYAAIQLSDCLFLENTDVIGDTNNNDGRGLMSLIILKEFNTSLKIPGQGSIVSFVLNFKDYSYCQTSIIFLD